MMGWGDDKVVREICTYTLLRDTYSESLALHLFFFFFQSLKFFLKKKVNNFKFILRTNSKKKKRTRQISSSQVLKFLDDHLRQHAANLICPSEEERIDNTRVSRINSMRYNTNNTPCSPDSIRLDSVVLLYILYCPRLMIFRIFDE